MDNKPQYSLVVALAVVALLGFGVYYSVVAVIDKLNTVNSDLGKALVTGAVAFAVGVVTLVIGKIGEQRVKIQQEVREKKIPVYEKQIETFFAVMLAQKTGAAAVSKEKLQKAFMAFTEKLIVWGSPEVINAWSAFRLHDWQNTKPEEGFLKLEEFLRAIRTDLGSSNSGLPVGELMRLFVNDMPPLGAASPKHAEPSAASDGGA
jgi:hypothetical protein